VVGKALSGTVVSTLQAIVILCFFPLLGLKLGPLEVVMTILFCAMVAFSISSFGIVLATFYESYESFSVIMNFIVMPMFFLSGALYPLKDQHWTILFASKLNPLTYGVDALKHMTNPLKEGPMSPDFPLMVDILVIVGISVVFVLLSGRLLERKG
jgi:ABC-2 type transport system permease protein